MKTNLMKTNFLLALFCLSLFLGGCGLFGDKEEDTPVYFEAVETDYLAVPRGLNEPRRDRALVILGDKGGPGATVDSSNLPPRVQITDGSQNIYARVNFAARGSYLLVEDSLENVYMRLKQAIENGGMELLDENSTESSYDFFYADPPRPKQKKGFFKSMLFWRDDENLDYSGNYRATLESDDDETRIYLLDMESKSTSEGAADVVLSQVLEGLG